MATPIFVIGASAGGIEAVSRLVRGLPADFGGAIFVAMHFPSWGISVLAQILERAGSLPATQPADGTTIESGHIYVAPPDHHMLVFRKRIRLSRGPRENGHRPAIDPLFRSAAVSHGNGVVGIVLTGNLDDGTAGLIAIKRRGGRAIVQYPAEALYASMPASAIAHARPDYVLPLDQIPAQMMDLAKTLAATRHAPEEKHMHDRDDAERETRFAQMDMAAIREADEHPGTPSTFGCPDCGGVLWELEENDMTRFRCRVGHAWTADALLGSQTEQLDQALWTALRALEENASLAESIAARARRRGNDQLARRYDRDAARARRSAQVIRDGLIAQRDGAGVTPEVAS